MAISRASKIDVINADELKAIFSGGWWPDFFRRYPKAQGLLKLSRVGFNQAGDRALLYIRNQWGGKSGLGGFVFLSLKGSQWVVTEKTVEIL